MKTIDNRFGEVRDVLGIGIGPFNLSVAALLAPIQKIKSYFFDQNNEFVWHSGMLLPDSDIQVSYLKDLVTLADPSSPYSFLAFLNKHKRLYRFINARFPRVRRNEFNQYLRWVSQSLSNCFFREKVERVDYSSNNKLFIMQTSRRVVKSKHLILGSGLTPQIPVIAKTYLGDTVFHSKDFMFKKQHCFGKRIMVIGGGQSGAEIVNNLIGDKQHLPSHITWVTRREQFSPIDDSVFANELFTPQHSKMFYQHNADTKEQLLKQHLLASDGISPYLLESIYQKLYDLEYLEGCGRFYTFLPNHALHSLRQVQTHYSIELHNKFIDKMQSAEADIIILCTGYQHCLPTYLSPILDNIKFDDNKFSINPDFSVVWNGFAENRIYIQNAARHSHGIADPNLSLMAYRSAIIINSITGQTIYDVDNNEDVLAWSDIYSPSTDEKEEIYYAKYA